MLLDGSRNAISFSVALETSIISVQHYLLDSLNNYKIGGLGPGLGFSMVDSMTLGTRIELFLGSNKLSFIIEIYVCNVKILPTGVFDPFADKFVK